MFAFLQKDKSNQTKWNQESHNPGVFAARRLVVIGDSIWYSSLPKSVYDKAENGMTEYGTNSKQIIQTIPYPSNIKPINHCCCQYRNQIYLIDGIQGEIILFDTKKKSYSKKQNIPKIGRFANAVVVSDNKCGCCVR